jgi:hypothetical protein
MEEAVEYAKVSQSHRTHLANSHIEILREDLRRAYGVAIPPTHLVNSHPRLPSLSLGRSHERRNPTVVIWSIPTNFQVADQPGPTRCVAIPPYSPGHSHDNLIPFLRQILIVAIPPYSSGQFPRTSGTRGSLGWLSTARSRNPTVLLWSIPTWKSAREEQRKSDWSQSHHTPLVNSHIDRENTVSSALRGVAIPPYSSGQFPLLELVL